MYRDYVMRVLDRVLQNRMVTQEIPHPWKGYKSLQAGRRFYRGAEEGYVVRLGADANKGNSTDLSYILRCDGDDEVVEGSALLRLLSTSAHPTAEDILQTESETIERAKQRQSRRKIKESDYEDLLGILDAAQASL